MKRLASFLNVHDAVRVVVLCLDLALASLAACLGVGVYALTTGAKAIGNYMSDRVMAACFLVIALVLDLAFAWLLGIRNPRSRFIQRVLLAAVATFFGAIVVLVIVATRAILLAPVACSLACFSIAR